MSGGKGRKRVMEKDTKLSISQMLLFKQSGCGSSRTISKVL